MRNTDPTPTRPAHRHTRSAPWRRLLMLALCAGLLALASACTHTQTTLGPPAFGPDLRQSSPKAGTATAAWNAWVRKGDTAAAQKALQARVTNAEIHSAPRTVDALTRFGIAELALHQADLTAAFEHHALVLVEHPDDPLARWSAARIWELHDYVPDWAARANTLAQSLVGVRLDPAARAWVNLSATHADYRVHRRDLSKDAWTGDAFGRAPSWRVAGPFSVFPVLDEDAPVAKAALSAPSLAGAYTVNDLTWTTRTFTADQPRLTPRFGATGIHVLESWMTVTEAVDVVAHLHTDSGARVYLNDDLILARDLASGYPPAHVGAQLNLQPGTYRVRIRLAQEYAQGDIALAFAPLDGRPAPMRFAATPPADAPKPTGTFTLSDYETIPGGKTTPPRKKGDIYRPPALYDTKRDFFTPFTNAQTDGHPFLLWLQARALLNAGDHGGARLRAQALTDLAPAWPRAHYVLGDAWRSASDASIDHREEQALGAWRTATERDPLAHFAADRLAFLLYSRGQLDEALELLDPLAAKLPDAFIVQYHRHLIFKDKDWTPQAQQTLREALERNSTNCTLVAAQWEFWARLETRPTPDALPKTFQSCDVTLENLALHHDLPRRDVKRAIARYERLVARNANTSGYRQMLAQLYALDGRHDLAQRTFREARPTSPDPNGVTLQRLDALLATKGVAPTLRDLDDLLKDDPGNYSYRRLRARLGKSAVLDDLRIDTQPLIDAYLESPTDQDASAVYLLDYAATRAFPDASSITVTHILIRVNNKQGIDDFGEVDIPQGALVLKIRTIKPDGQVIEPEFVDNKPSISMPNLAPGDFIEYQYLEATERTFLRRGAYLGMRFFFNIFDAPMLRSEYILDVPSSWKLDIERRNDAPTPEVTQKGAFTRHRFIVRDAPRAIGEPAAVGSIEILPSIQSSHRYTWADVYATYRDRILANARPSQLAARIVREATRGAKTERARALALFEYVQEAINDDSSGIFAAPSAHTLASGTGDRLIALHTLLQAADIESTIVLGRPINQDPALGALPVIDAWSFPILRTVLDGKTVWLDPNLNHAPFDFIPVSLQGAKGLVMGPLKLDRGPRATVPEALFVDIPAQDPLRDQRVVTLTLALDKAGNVKGTGSETYSGSGASLLRRILDRYTDREELRQAFAQGIAPSFPGLELIDFTVKGRDDGDKPLTVTYNFASSGFAQPATSGRGLRIERALYPADLEATWAPLATRQTPLNLTEPIRQRTTIRITAPKGWSIALDARDAARAEGRYGTFERTLATKGATLTVEQTLDLPPQRVEPAAYAGFKDFVRAFDQAELLRLTVAPK